MQVRPSSSPRPRPSNCAPDWCWWSTKRSRPRGP